MIRPRLAILPILALGAGLVACAPNDPYYASGPVYSQPVVQQAYPTPYAPQSPYAAPMPAYVGQGDAYGRQAPVQQGYAAAPVADSYCQEAYANAVGTSQQAAMTGSYADAARANRSAGFFRRDC